MRRRNARVLPITSLQRLTVSFDEVLLVGFGAGRPGPRPRATVLLIVVGARVVRVLGAGAVLPLLAVLGRRGGEASAEPERGRGRAITVIVDGQILALSLIRPVVSILPSKVLRVIADADAQIQRLILEHDSSWHSSRSVNRLPPPEFLRRSIDPSRAHTTRTLGTASRNPFTNACYPALSEATTMNFYDIALAGDFPVRTAHDYVSLESYLELPLFFSRGVRPPCLLSRDASHFRLNRQSKVRLFTSG